VLIGEFTACAPGRGMQGLFYWTHKVRDYLPDRNRLSQTFQGLLAEPGWLQDYRNQLDWRLAHLTTKRIDFERQPVWNPARQFEHLERLISEFLNALPQDARALFDPNRQ
jgi:hypothetical protein